MMPEQEEGGEMDSVVNATHRLERAIMGPFMDDVANDDGLEDYNDELREICLLD